MEFASKIIIDALVVRNSFLRLSARYYFIRNKKIWCAPKTNRADVERGLEVCNGWQVFCSRKAFEYNSHSFLCSINSKKCSLFASLFVYFDAKRQRKEMSIINSFVYKASQLVQDMNLIKRNSAHKLKVLNFIDFLSFPNSDDSFFGAMGVE